jgi:hypothetical protein
MLEDSKVDGFLMRLQCPRDRMLGFDGNPTNQVALLKVRLCQGRVAVITRLAMDLKLFHPRHGERGVCSVIETPSATSYARILDY